MSSFVTGVEIVRAAGALVKPLYIWEVADLAFAICREVVDFAVGADGADQTLGQDAEGGGG